MKGKKQLFRKHFYNETHFCLEKTCPAGWSMFSCSCYLLSEMSDTWDKGRKDCKDKGADLVVIDSAEEQVK